MGVRNVSPITLKYFIYDVGQTDARRAWEVADPTQGFGSLEFSSHPVKSHPISSRRLISSVVND